MGSLISKKCTEVREKTDRSFVKGAALLAQTGAQIFKGAEVAGETTYLEFVLVWKMVPHKANHNDVRMALRLCKISIVEVVPISCRSSDRSDLGDAARSGKCSRNIFLQQGFIDSMEKKRIPEDHDSWAFSNSDFLCDFREIMDVDAIVIEGGSKDSRDNFEQDSGPRQHGEDFPLGAFKTGSR